MFGISTWKWLAAAVGLSIVSMFGIPGLSAIAGLLSIISGLVVIMILVRWLFTRGGSMDTNDTRHHDRALRNYYGDKF